MQTEIVGQWQAFTHSEHLVRQTIISCRYKNMFMSYTEKYYS